MMTLHDIIRVGLCEIEATPSSENGGVDFRAISRRRKSMKQVRRRHFLLATGALLAAPLAARAQPAQKG